MIDEAGLANTAPGRVRDGMWVVMLADVAEFQFQKQILLYALNDQRISNS